MSASSEPSEPPRYSDARFPERPYVPGVGPHPTRDEGGFYRDRKRPAAAPLASEDWRSSPLYREGVDAFNLGFFWEAHEAWEEQWHANGRRGDEATLLVILIRSAAARLKMASGVEGGRDALMRSARARLGELRRDRMTDELCGLSLMQLEVLQARWFAGETAWLLPGGAP